MRSDELERLEDSIMAVVEPRSHPDGVLYKHDEKRARSGA